jgi:hypothetical protein
VARPPPSRESQSRGEDRRGRRSAEASAGPTPPVTDEAAGSRRRRNREGPVPVDTSVVVYEGPPSQSR